MITKEEVKKIAKLARIGITEAEEEKFTKDISSVLDYFDKLKKDVFLIYENFLKDMNNTFMGKFIRIDFFVNKKNYWFGEFSLFPNGGRGDNLNEFGKKTFIRSWIPEVFEIFGE